MAFRSLLFCLGICAGQLGAQDLVPRPEAPPWGVAVLLGRGTGDSAKPYGNDYGVEFTWQFLRDHWVQGRLRSSIIHVNRGEGVPDGLYFTPTEAKFLVVSSDWIFRPMKGHGPYLLLGAGANYHQAERYDVNRTDSQTGTNLALAWGVGWLIVNQVEVELRQDVLVVDFGLDARTSRDALCTSLVLRKRF
jgi:hypothetical protein